MSEIKWQEPPTSRMGGGNAGRWADVAGELRANPGRWALVAEDEHASVAVSIKQARLAAFKPSGAFEAVTRNTRSTRRVDIFARFIGRDGEHR